LNRSALQHLTHDEVLLFITRFVRLFSYGALSVVLVFYLTGLGLNEAQTGMLLTLTLLGDTALQGGGTVTLGGGVIQAPLGATPTLTNMDNTIQGDGAILTTTLHFVNQTGGTLLANTPGRVLLIKSGDLTNAGLMEATNGGQLLLLHNLSAIEMRTGRYQESYAHSQRAVDLWAPALRHR